MTRHPSTSTWRLPPEREPLGGGLARTNLRALAARPGRLEHHLLVVGQVGDAQLEIATASEPLYFAHRNVSDEYVVALPSGDGLIDSMPFRVFLGDPETGADVARLLHRAGDLVLHPEGWLHWPGRLRPPFEPPPFPPGGRRAVVSFVFCASRPTPPGDRPVWVAEGRAKDAKPYVDAPPPLLLDGLDGEPRELGRIGDVRMALAEPPFAPARGGYVLVLEGDGESTWTADLVHIEAGASWAGEGVARALLMSSEAHDAEPPPRVWDRVPELPFPTFEVGERGALPTAVGDLRILASSEREVRVELGEQTAIVPRHWLARLLYRIAVHTTIDDGARLDAPRACFGYVETYGGFFYDDHGGGHRLGLRGTSPVDVPAAELLTTLERLYRAVAPEGYVELI